MVSIEKKDGFYHFNILGWHKLWCLKRRIIIPEENVVFASVYSGSFSGLQGIRLPGTYLPGVITAGTYYTGEGWIFCDIVNPDRCLEIGLERERYRKLIVQVKDPDSDLQLFQGRKTAPPGTGQSKPISEK